MKLKTIKRILEKLMKDNCKSDEEIKRLKKENQVLRLIQEYNKQNDLLKRR